MRQTGPLPAPLEALLAAPRGSIAVTERDGEEGNIVFSPPARLAEPAST